MLTFIGSIGRPTFWPQNPPANRTSNRELSTDSTVPNCFDLKDKWRSEPQFPLKFEAANRTENKPNNLLDRSNLLANGAWDRKATRLVPFIRCNNRTGIYGKYQLTLPQWNYIQKSSWIPLGFKHFSLSPPFHRNTALLPPFVD